jgi:hypothetical protein
MRQRRKRLNRKLTLKKQNSANGRNLSLSRQRDKWRRPLKASLILFSTLREERLL